MKKIISLFMALAMVLSLAACSTNEPPSATLPEESSSLEVESSMPTNADDTANHFPASLNSIPDSYLTEAEQQGTLQDLYYDTYESFFSTMKRAKGSKSTPSCICPMAMTKASNILCSTLCTVVGATNIPISAAPMSRRE